MSDLIDRQAAIDAIYNAFCYAYCDNCEKGMDENLCGDCHRKYQNWSASKESIKNALNKIVPSVIDEMPTVEPDEQIKSFDEWCTDCKEYDSERHCCPRWNRVIRQTLNDIKKENK